MQQLAMIERVREACRRDERVVAAMMYGSFTLGEGDSFSDIEFLLFFEDEALPAVDPTQWLSQVAPVEVYFTNEFGVGTAIFSNLIRGEFHFDPASRIRETINPSLRSVCWYPSLEATLVKDSTGELTACLQALIGPAPPRGSAEELRFTCRSLANWTIFGTNVLARGEVARALEIIGWIQRDLLWLARLQEGSTEHWPTPSRGLEQDLSPAGYARFAACTARLDARDLRQAYRAAWTWGRELMQALAEPAGVALPESLVTGIDRRLTDWPSAG